MSGQAKKHEDTSISLHGMTIEDALKKAMNAGPYPTKPKAVPKRSSTSQRAPRRSPKAK